MQMTQANFERICRKAYTKDGVTIVPAPLEKSGYFVRQGDEEYIFVNSRLSKDRRQKLVNYFMEKREAMRNGS